MLHAEQQTLDLEGEDRTETIVVGLRYTGTDAVESPQRPRQSGGWPGRAAFQGGTVSKTDDDGRVRERDPGPIQIGIVPDTIDNESVEGGTLPGLENLPDFEVIYDPAELAAAILEANYLPPSAFGGNETPPDYAIRERVFEALDIDDALGTAPAAEQQIREALAETAGVDLEEEEPADVSRETEYKEQYSRSDLYAACQALELDVEWRSAGKTEMAEMLAQESPGDVREAFDADDGEE